MNLVERTLAWLTGRKPQPDMTIRCSIHTGSNLAEIYSFTIEDDDVAAFTMRAGTVTALTLDLTSGSSAVHRLVKSGLEEATTEFVRVTLAGTNVEQWLRMQTWTMEGNRLVSAHFSREYPSRRWNERDGYYTETRVEPSPPVPFDEHHPHYEGSAQQHHADLAIGAAGGW